VSINFQELRDLLGAISQTDITELILKNNDFELTVRKETAVVAVPQVTSVPTRQDTVTSTEATSVVVTEVVAETPPSPGVEDKKWVDITSPMVGTFYSAPAPDEEPFVTVGDRINKGDTVCIIEAMKLMNEIEGEISGQIMEVSVQNGEPVEFGQVLMRINPG
jgi:acetyl-CoA carboxylase biotin carboxyl carrier protein